MESKSFEILRSWFLGCTWERGIPQNSQVLGHLFKMREILLVPIPGYRASEPIFRPRRPFFRVFIF